MKNRSSNTRFRSPIIARLVVALFLCGFFGVGSSPAQNISEFSIAQSDRLNRLLVRAQTSAQQSAVSALRINYEIQAELEIHGPTDVVGLLQTEDNATAVTVGKVVETLEELLVSERAFLKTIDDLPAFENLRIDSSSGVPEWVDPVTSQYHLLPPSSDNKNELLDYIERLVFAIEKTGQRIEVRETQAIALKGLVMVRSNPDPVWQFIGPSVIPNGEGHDGSRVPVSGRVPTLAIDWSENGSLIVGSAIGGIWRGKQFGTSWEALTDDQPILATGSVATTPVAPSLIVVGTGEANIAFRSLAVTGDRLLAGQSGNGVLRSTDFGQSWEVLASDLFDDEAFSEIEFLPGSGNKLLAAATSGLFLSEDVGETWVDITPPAPAISSNFRPATSIAVDPRNADIAYVGIWGEGIYKTVNLLSQNRRWKRLRGGLPLSNLGRLELDIANKNPDALIALYSTSDHNFRGVFYSSSAGATWDPIAGFPDVLQGQGFYNMLAGFHLDNPSVAFIGGVGHRPNEASSLFRLEISDDGWSFTPVGGEMHVDFHDLKFDPRTPGIVYASNDGGVWRSADSGETWVAINDGLGITQVIKLAARSLPENYIIAGTQDNGTITYTADRGWLHGDDGDGGYVAIDPFDQSIVFSTFFQHRIARSEKRGDPGTFKKAHPTSLVNPSKVALLAPFALNPYVEGEIILGADQLYLSHNRGVDWIGYDFDFTGPSERIRKSVISTVKVFEQDLIAVGTSDGRVWIVERDGQVLQPKMLTTIGSEEIGLSYVSDILNLSTETKNSFLVSISDGPTAGLYSIKAKNDTLTSVEKIYSGAVNTIESSPDGANLTLLGTNEGVMVFDQSAGSVKPFGKGLPKVPVFDLELDETGKLYAGTFGRGVWQTYLPGQTMQ